MSKFNLYLERGKTDLTKSAFNILSSKKGKFNDEEDVHDPAEEIGASPHKLENAIYNLSSSFFAAGKFNASGKDASDFDPKEIAMGMKVEMEHTTNKDIAKRIACDHLTEIPDYYTRLKKMEAEAGIKD
jgi:hypothetical protein